MPQCFQGRTWFAVIFEPEQRERIYGLVADDDNGCWKDKNRRFGRGKKLDDERKPSEGSTTQQFKPGKTYTNRSVTSEMRKLASPVARGKSLTSRDIYFEVASAVREMDRALNPFHGPTGSRQAATIKTAANKEVYGSDAESYLRAKDGVILRQYLNEDGTKSENYILVDPYRVGLLAVNASRQEKRILHVQLDVTFNLCNMFVVTMVIQHPFCKKPALVIGSTMLTQKKSRALYAVFPNYLRECLIGVGLDVLSEDWVFNFVTDGERALYEAFRQAFPRHNHTLCVLHIRKGIERYFDGKKTASEIAAGSRGTIRTINFLEKLVLPARETIGFSRDMLNTNLAEAEHKALEPFFGKRKDPREVAERLLKLYADQLTHLFQCMKNQGK
ncbi:hypothetical protein RvY_10115 [Ramazzottius varieornatus]|uniref:MULE transposase domain-containing protein n=1 Tax=Ramazzottius varieornatus TaxID=947166 RepID=A0A1D1VBQ5_RAMVA|nr:hypothetical protein RvY_10115 [Ramazzottius varieornatus]